MNESTMSRAQARALFRLPPELEAPRPLTLADLETAAQAADSALAQAQQQLTAARRVSVDAERAVERAQAAFDCEPTEGNERAVFDARTGLESARLHHERAERVEKAAREKAEQATKALARHRASEAHERDAAAWQARKKELRAEISETAGKLVAHARELGRDGQLAVTRELQRALCAALHASDGVEIGDALTRAVFEPRYPER